MFFSVGSSYDKVYGCWYHGRLFLWDETRVPCCTCIRFILFLSSGQEIQYDCIISSVFKSHPCFLSYFTVGLLIYHNEMIPCSCRFFSSICYYHWTCLLSKKKKKRGKRSLDMLSPTPCPLHLTPPEFFFSFSDTCVIIQYAPWLEA